MKCSTCKNYFHKDCFRKCISCFFYICDDYGYICNVCDETYLYKNIYLCYDCNPSYHRGHKKRKLINALKYGFNI